MDHAAIRGLLVDSQAVAARRAQLAADLNDVRARGTAAGLPRAVLHALIRGNIADALVLALAEHGDTQQVSEQQQKPVAKKRYRPVKRAAGGQFVAKAAPASSESPAVNGHAAPLGVGAVVEWGLSHEGMTRGTVTAILDGTLAEIRGLGDDDRRWRLPIDAVAVLRPPPPPPRPPRGTTRIAVERLIEDNRDHLVAMPTRESRDQWIAAHVAAGIIIRRDALRAAGL